MALTANEQRALHKAIELNGAALVRRLEHGVYEVPSATRNGQTHIVTGVAMDASDHACTCEAGTQGLVCWHSAAVRLARVQHEAKRQGRVIDGEYRGCYRRGVHWRVPLATLERLQAAQQREWPGASGRGPLGRSDAQEVFAALKAYVDERVAALKREIVASHTAGIRVLERGE
jgi:hypothetical protein